MKNKTVLIISDDSDQATNRVMDWLFKWNIPVIRINDTSPLFLEYLTFDNGELKFRIRIDNQFNQESTFISDDDIQSVWYRRGELNFSPHQFLDSAVPVAMKRYLLHEKQKLADFFYYIFASRYKSLNSWFNNSINKMEVLVLAGQCGLQTPYSLISSSSDVIKRELEHRSPITKALDYSFILDNNFRHYGFTSGFSAQTLENGQSYFPTLFQENVNKKYELRIFYLDGQCYSSAILSQNDEQTSTDFRNYNMEKPNRIIPFTLPDTVEQQIGQLMHTLKMESGSIDMIVTQSHEYVFLEVNPIGQFWQVSYPCSYYLEEKIAHYLSN